MPRKMVRTPDDRTQLTLVTASASKPSKIGQVTELLMREEGATLAELIAATGWQPHTTRAALTGLRKKGHTIEKGKCGSVTFYRITQDR